uniref:Uncharacterized protein n=1 Tax=Sus scrofa TaxID=9823 RepID=A0A4X1VDC6_PIG
MLCSYRNKERPKIIFFFFFFFFCFLGPHPQHMEVPRLGVQSERQLLATATATAMWDPSRVCELHHSSQQRQILNPLSEARDRTLNLMVLSRICFRCAMTGTPKMFLNCFPGASPIPARASSLRLPRLTPRVLSPAQPSPLDTSPRRTHRFPQNPWSRVISLPSPEPPRLFISTVASPKGPSPGSALTLTLLFPHQCSCPGLRKTPPHFTPWLHHQLLQPTFHQDDLPETQTLSHHPSFKPLPAPLCYQAKLQLLSLGNPLTSQISSLVSYQIFQKTTGYSPHIPYSFLPLLRWPSPQKLLSLTLDNMANSHSHFKTPTHDLQKPSLPSLEGKTFRPPAPMVHAASMITSYLFQKL